MKIDDRSEATGSLRDYKELVESKGWKRLMLLVDDQQKVRSQNLILNPLKTLDSAMEQEFTKGEYSGIGLFATLPGTQIDLYSQMLKLEPEEKDDGNSNA